MIRIPRSKTGLAAYILSIFVLTFSAFVTSNASLPHLATKAPSPTPQIPLQQAVLGTETGQIAHVTRIVDGDTFVIDTGEKVRLIGVDTPETVDPRKPVQCFGKEASAFTSKRLLNQEVRLVKDVSNTDSFGRLLRYVYIGSELFNNTLVNEGYAYARSYPPDVAKQQQLRASEKEASLNSRGLWGDTCKTK